MMKPYPILITIIVFSGLLACAGTQVERAGMKTDTMQIIPQRLADIAGIQWHLQKMKTGKRTVTLIKDTENTFSCDENGRVAGVATINRYFGSFSLREDGEIIWNKAFGMTRMAGPSNLMQQEAQFMQALPLTSRIYLKMGTLVLISSDQSTLLEFEKSE